MYIIYFVEIFKMFLCKVVDVNFLRDLKISWFYWGIFLSMVDNLVVEVKFVMLIFWFLLRFYGRVINDCDDSVVKFLLYKFV